MTNLLTDFVPIRRFAKDVGKCTRTVLRWMKQADGLPYTRLGIDPSADCARVAHGAHAAAEPGSSSARAEAMSRRHE
jgi:hypothetical protein